MMGTLYLPSDTTAQPEPAPAIQPRPNPPRQPVPGDESNPFERAVGGLVDPLLGLAGAAMVPLKGYANIYETLAGDPLGSSVASRLLNAYSPAPGGLGRVMRSPEMERGGEAAAQALGFLPQSLSAGVERGMEAITPGLTRAGVPSGLTGLLGATGETLAQVGPALLGIGKPGAGLAVGRAAERVGGAVERGLTPFQLGGGVPGPGARLAGQVAETAVRAPYELNVGTTSPVPMPGDNFTEQQRKRIPLVRDAMSQGFKIKGTTFSEGVIPTAVESFGKKLKIENSLSEANQNARNSVIERELGLQPGSLSVDALNSFIEDQLTSYRNLAAADLGERTATVKPAYATEWNTIPGQRQVPQFVDPTTGFKDLVSGIVDKYSKPSQMFPNALEGPALNALQKKAADFMREMKPDEVLGAIIDLRNQAKHNLKQGQIADYSKIRTGQFDLEMAHALEGLMEEHLAATGQTELLNAYRDSRQNIAKAHDVLASIDPITNNVSGAALALRNKRVGNSMTGGLKTAADFAATFPEVNKNLKGTTIQNALSPWDIVWGISAVSSGHPLAAVAELGARGLAPKIVGSNWYQRRYASPDSPANMPGMVPAVDVVGAIAQQAYPGMQVVRRQQGLAPYSAPPPPPSEGQQ